MSQLVLDILKVDKTLVTQYELLYDVCIRIIFFNVTEYLYQFERRSKVMDNTVLYLNLLQVKNRMLSRWRWCPRTWKGQQLMGKEAVCEYIWLATCQSKIYENKPPFARPETRLLSFGKTSFQA